MKKPLALAAAIVAVVGLASVVAVAGETTKVRTSVSLHFHIDSHPRSLTGRVRANRGCQKRRKVVLYSEYGTAVDSDKSDARGKFKVVTHPSSGRSGRARYAHRAGRYNAWVVAERKRITSDDGDRIVCKKGKSRSRLVA